MPPKRKALAEADTNKGVAGPPAKKTAKADSTLAKKAASAKKTATAKKTTAPKAAKPRKYKYSNPETLSAALPLDLVDIGWRKHDEDSSDSEDEENPEVDDKLTKDAKSANILSYKITSCGMEKFEWMVEEQQKRDPDYHQMYIYNDFAGYGTTEMMENMFQEFNKVIFKRDISPFKKWAFIEGLATFLKLGELGYWMMSSYPDTLRNIGDIFGTMLLTSFDMLSEHGLLAPDSSIPNIGILSLLMIEFAETTGRRLGIGWSLEVIRALDRAGVELKPMEEARVSQEKLDELRNKYEEKEDEDFEDGKNIYQVFAKKTFWEPDDDLVLGERMWARWDWRKEFSYARLIRRGGDQYNIEKMSEKEKRQYIFGTDENSRSMEGKM